MGRNEWRRHVLFGGILGAAVLAVIVTAAILPGRTMLSFNSVELSGETATEVRDVTGFDRIKIRGGYKLSLTAGREHSLEIEGDSAILAILDSRIEDGELIVEPKERRRINDFDAVELRVGLPTLAGLTVDGAVEAALSDIDSERLAITINGAGDIEAAGTCASLVVTTNGAGNVDTRDLRCADVNVTINGAGDAAVYASQSVWAQVNGVGDIDIYGNPPEVRKSSSGLGSIDIRDEPTGAD